MSALRRASIGCGLAIATFVAVFGLLLGSALVLGWAHPEIHGQGEGQGFLLIPYVPAAAFAGLVGVWRARFGIGLAAIIVASALAIAIVVVFQGL